MSNNDFFLEPDDAKTLGDVEYMRQPNRVKHTFPKTKGNGSSFSIEKEVTAMEKRVYDDRFGMSSQRNTNADEAMDSSSFSSTPQLSPKVKTDTTMDMFRKMAKKLKR